MNWLNTYWCDQSIRWRDKTREQMLKYARDLEGVFWKLHNDTEEEVIKRGELIPDWNLYRNGDITILEAIERRAKYTV